MRVAKDESLLYQMKPGHVYRRYELVKYSTAVDRHLEKLLRNNKILKLSAGLYVKPETSAFGVVPPSDKDLVSTFLKDDQFLINSFNNYTQLGLGLTQLYNNQVVYNYKRHGDFELGGKLFSFKRLPKFPKLLTKEYLLIDMFNNLKNLAENQNLIVLNFIKNKNLFDEKKLQLMAKKYGRVKTLRLIEKAYTK